MSKLYTHGRIGTLELPNRMIRSATAERMADEDGTPRIELLELYQELARGGVGLIITGHMYIHASGKCHSEMTAIDSDERIPALTHITEAVHAAGGRIAVQINHGGLNCSEETVAEAIAPSDINAEFASRSARAMTSNEIEEIIEAYAKAASRVKEAGFDAVQIHGAHGYLVGQFLSPLTNQRNDRWGGSHGKRMRFLRDVCSTVRSMVGADFPVFIKLGMVDGVEGGLTLEDGLQVVAQLEDMGLDAVEVSGGMGGPLVTNTLKGIKVGVNEGYFVEWAKAARKVTNLPISVVGGFRSRSLMEGMVDGGAVDFISLCRPLISEPDLPERFRLGLQERSICISANLCYPKQAYEGIACRCKVDRSLRGEG
jgi:2,4-dienoyl-CoA reductase-like NADH-dependent reductase (Old Yellow Enzyme family)